VKDERVAEKDQDQVNDEIFRYVQIGTAALLFPAAAISLVRYHLKRRDKDGKLMGIDWWAVENALALLVLPTALILYLLRVIGQAPFAGLILAAFGYAFWARKRHKVQ
jgi:hypothetical protein